MMAEYVTDGAQQPVRESGTEGTPDAPVPWYRNRIYLVLWALMVALLLTLIVYGIVELSRGGGSSIPAPQTSSTTTSPAPATSTPSTTTEAPPSETPEQTPQQTPQEAPPPANESPDEPPEHRRHLHIPSTITLPHTVITLPHGF